MKELRELRYPTEEEMREALEASEQGPEAVLEFLRKGRAEHEGRDHGNGKNGPEAKRSA